MTRDPLDASQRRMLAGRYELTERRASAGQSVEFRAKDVRTNRDVMIWTVDTVRQNARHVDGLRRLYLGTARLWHPGLIRAVAFGHDHHEDRAYLVMDTGSRMSLRRLMGTERRIGGNRLLTIMADVCRALAFLHDRGIVHGRIDAEHVFVDDTGAALMGVMLPEERASEAQHRAACQRDLLALASTLIECVTGEPLPSPHGGGVAEDAAQWRVMERALLRVDHPVLAGVLADLLDPAFQPELPTAARVIDAIATLTGRSLPLESEATLVAYVRSAPSVGQQHILDELARYVDRAPEEGVLAVTGEEGIGKAKILDEFAHRCRADGMRVISCEPQPMDRLPAAALLRVLQDLVAPDLGRPGVAVSDDIQFADWVDGVRSLIPATARRWTPEFEGIEDAPSRAIASMLVELSESSELPVVLTLSNVESADEHTWSLVEILVDSALAGRTIPRIVLTAHGSRSAVGARRLDMLQSRGCLIELGVTPMSQSETEALVQGIFGDHASVPVGSIAGAVHRLTGGYPDRVKSTIETALRLGRIARRPRGWVLRGAPLDWGSDEQPATGGTKELNPDEVRVLSRLARPASIDVLAAIVGGAEARDRVSASIASGMFVRVPVAGQPVYRVASARSTAAPPDAAIAESDALRIAEALVRIGPTDCLWMAEIARQFLAAGESWEASGWFVRAGDAARDDGARQRAIEFYLDALATIAPEHDGSDVDMWSEERGLRGRGIVQRMVGLIDYLGKWHGIETVADTVEAIASATRSRSGHGVALALRAHAAQRQGRLVDAVGMLRGSLEAFEAAGDRLGTVLATSMLGETHVLRGEADLGAQLADRLASMADQHDDPLAAGRAAGLRGNIRLFRGDLSAAEDAYRLQLGVSEDRGDARDQAIALSNLGIVLRRAGHYGRAMQVYRRVIELTRRTRDRERLAIAHGNLGVLYFYLGDASAAQRHLTRQRRLVDTLADDRQLAAVDGNLAEVEAELGRHERAARRFRRAVERCAALGLAYYEGYFAARAAEHALSIGREEEADDLADRAQRVAGTCQDEEALFLADFVRAELHLRRADSAAARIDAFAALERLVARARNSDPAVRRERIAKVHMTLFDRTGDPQHGRAALHQYLLLARESEGAQQRRNARRLRMELAFHPDRQRRTNVLPARGGDPPWSSFLAMMGHEMRTPVRAIVGLTELADKGEVDREAMMRYCELIGRTARSVDRLVDDLFDFALLSSEQLTVSRAPFDPVEAIREATRLATTSPARSGTSHSIRLDENLPRRIVGDRDRFMQILGILLDNAIEHGGGGDVRIDVTTMSSAEFGREVSPNLVHPRSVGHGPRDYLVVRIHDDGPGVPESLREQIFEPFARGATVGSSTGAGLGLAIASHLARRMGGKLRYVDSAEVDGATFEIGLELDETDEQPVSVDDAAGARPVPRRSEKSRFR